MRPAPRPPVESDDKQTALLESLKKDYEATIEELKALVKDPSVLSYEDTIKHLTWLHKQTISVIEEGFLYSDDIEDGEPLQ
jgi:hypothetical protein